ncbi:MAG: restriction endonuclease subunit S, partial [Hyphomonadaceae bacterium]|nr:restriction endonuclease subunit S [Hyphomonadaceae bacterium]
GEVLGEKRSALITAAVTGRLDPVSGQIRDSAEGRGVRLKYVCSLYGDYGLNVSADDYIQDGIPIIRTSDFDDLGRLDLSNPKMISEDIAPSKMLRRGDVLFSRAGTVGRCTVYNNPRPSTFASYLVRFRPKTSIADPRFIGWWAQSHQYWSQVRAGTIETTIGNFNAVRFGNLILPNVALTVQRAIADFLDRKTATIDELIEKTDASIDLWKEYRAALITAAVTGQIDVTTWKGHTAHRPGAIGEAPK